jgi:hypothetical protein
MSSDQILMAETWTVKTDRFSVPKFHQIRVVHADNEGRRKAFGVAPSSSSSSPLDE